MSYYAKVFDNKIQLLIEDAEGKLHQQREMFVGEQLLDFLYSDPKEILNTFENVYNITVACAHNHTRISITGILQTFDHKNIYLQSFVELLLETLILGEITSPEGFEKLRNQHSRAFMIMEREGYFINPTYKTVSKHFLLCLFSIEALGAMEFIENQLNFCFEEKNNMYFHDFSPMERLYIYEQWRKSKGELPLYFESESFPSSLIISENIELEDNFSIDELANKLKKLKPEITEMTLLSNGWALMRYEIMKMITQDVNIKKCANCGRFFIVDGRSDIKYCSRPLKDEPKKTCQDKGALKKYMHKVQSEPIRKEFHKAYKRNHSRVSLGKLSQQEFLNWSDEARAKRDQCIAGELSENAFFDWINSDRKYKKQK